MARPKVPFDSDVQTEVSAPPVSSSAVTRCTLRVVEGPDKDRTLVLDGAEPGRVFIGTSPACDLRLTDPSVSRRHASIEIVGPRVRITDLGSTNGVWIEDLAVVEALVPGARTVRLGGTSVRIDTDQTTRRPLPEAHAFGPVMGASAEMRRIYPLAQKLAASAVPLLIEGETGTGKELFAEAIHRSSARASRPFVVFDCTAVPPSLIESALFGHEKGAFTGAVNQRKGAFEQADGGTLLIDEIGDLGIDLQAKLLRALQRQEFQRVGGERAHKFDVRVMAATRRDLDREVQTGRFRDDLYYRLVVARVELPPLRRRRGDVALLTRHFWEKMGGEPSGPSAELVARLDGYAWPGNIRELENTVARVIALGDLASLEAGAAGSFRGDGETSGEPLAAGDRSLLEQPFSQARQAALTDFERRYVEHALARNGNNVARAAAASGVALRYFQLVRARHNR